MHALVVAFLVRSSFNGVRTRGWGSVSAFRGPLVPRWQLFDKQINFLRALAEHSRAQEAEAQQALRLARQQLQTQIPWLNSAHAKVGIFGKDKGGADGPR